MPKHLIYGAGALCLVMPASAIAQTASTPIADEAHELTVIGEPVTELNLMQESTAAGRLNLSSLETPASVAVISGDLIRDWGYPTINEAQSRAPGVSAAPHNGNGNSALSLRGFYGATAISQLYDGVQLINAGSVNGFPFDPWNVERIEILYGPASVLYGAGAVGGALNVIGKKPNPTKFINQGQVSYGSFDTRRIAVDSTGPVNSWLSYRFSASHMRTDHWVERAHAKSLAVSTALRADVSPSLIVSLFHDLGDQRPSTYEGTPTQQGRILPELRFKNYNFADASVKFKENRTRLNATWAPSEDFTLVVDGYRSEFSRRYRYTYNFTYLPATQQVRRTTFRDIDSPQNQAGATSYAVIKTPIAGLRNELVVGGSYARSVYDRLDNTVAGYNGGLTILDALDFAPGLFTDSGAPVARPQYDVTVRQSGLFFQDRLLLSEQVSVVGGMRWDRYRLHYDDYASGRQSYGTMTGTSYHLGFVYKPIPGLSLYGQLARAVDPVSSLGSIGTNSLQFNLSPGRQTEIGIKQSLWNGRLEWTLAAYRIVKKDLLTPSAALAGVTEQVGRQSSKGFEASIAFRPWDQLAIEANGTILDARFDDFHANVGGRRVSLTGNVPQWVPERTANLRMNWDFAARWQLRGALKYVGSRFADNTNNVKLPHYTVADVGLRWLATDNVKLDLRADNLFDRLYPVVAHSANSYQWFLAAPRAVTATANVSF